MADQIFTVIVHNADPPLTAGEVERLVQDGMMGITLAPSLGDHDVDFVEVKQS